MRVRPLRPPIRLAMARSIFRLAAWAALCSFAVHAVPARADIQEPIKAHTRGEREQRRGEAQTPATPSPRKVEIHQGEAIEIVLTARGQIGRTVEFMIRSGPAHGTLEGPPRQLTRNTASVTYVHRAEDGPGDDSFTYAVQSTGGSVSAAVPVSVTILEDSPLLAASPAELDFGTVKTGETTRARVTLENRGGGVAAGRVEPPPPWIVDGPADYHLAHGESQTFQIVFQPAYGRSYVESTHFRPDSGATVRLIGAAIGPRDPAEDADAGLAAASSSPAATRDMAAVIARGNALARAAENAAAGPAAAPAGPPAGPLPGVPAKPVPGAAAVSGGASALPEPGSATASAPPPSSNLPPASAGGVFGGSAGLPGGGTDSVVLNEAAVRAIDLRGQGTSTLDLSWAPPRPTPKSYRVELRYLRLDEDEKLHVDWRPYAKVDFQPTPNVVTARVSGLPAETRQTLRVVAVDDAGHLALPSPTLSVMTRPGSTWWHVTPLKVLILGLLLCLGLLIYRKWEDRQILQSIDDSRAERDAGLLYRP